LPALAVNITIVHPWDVVFPGANALWLGGKQQPSARVNNYEVQAIIVYCLIVFIVYMSYSDT
jgi:hypothetical protein